MYNDQLVLSMTGSYWRSGKNVVERVEPHDDVAQCAGKITSPLQNTCSSVNLVCEKYCDTSNQEELISLRSG